MTVTRRRLGDIALGAAIATACLEAHFVIRQASRVWIPAWIEGHRTELGPVEAEDGGLALPFRRHDPYGRRA